MHNFTWISICWVACLIHTGTLESFVWCTQVRLKALSDSQVRLKALSDSHRYSWKLCLIHTVTLESLVWFTQVLLKALSDSHRYSWNLCLIHTGTLESFVWFTQVRLKALSDSHRYSWNLCLIHTGTLESFKGPKFSGYHCMMTKPLDTKIQKYTINTCKSLNSRFEAKEPVKSFVGMFRKMKISLYDNWRTAVWFWWIILTY